MLQLENVTKQFSNKLVLRGLSFRAPRGETTVLLGSSGCGKSTVLRLALGLTSPDSGRVRLDGQPPPDASNAERRQRVGTVTQAGGLFPHLTARQNITLLAEDMGWDAPRLETRLRELTDLTRLPTDALDRFPLQLSGGQRQRVALARALFLDPTILLLDEPLSALDPVIRYELQRELRAIFDSLEQTVVLVTHDLDEAAWFGHTIVMLDQGVAAQVGTFEDLVERPATPTVERFVRAQRGHRAGRGAPCDD